MTFEYSKEVEKEFRNPKNFGDMKNPDGVGKVGNPLCGDIMHLYIKVNKKKGKEILSDIKFKAFGCAAAIASSSRITQIAKGKEISKVKKITTSEITNSLKGLPPIKLHCADMAAKALKLAIEDYEKNK